MDEANNENVLPNSNKQLFIFNLNATELPSKFNNKIVAELEDEYVVRANVESEEDINIWVREFGSSTMTQWNFRRSHTGVQKISYVFYTQTLESIFTFVCSIIFLDDEFFLTGKHLYAITHHS